MKVAFYSILVNFHFALSLFHLKATQYRVQTFNRVSNRWCFKSSALYFYVCRVLIVTPLPLKVVMSISEYTKLALWKFKTQYITHKITLFYNDQYQDHGSSPRVQYSQETIFTRNTIIGIVQRKLRLGEKSINR
jgi:hypothetical protein